MAQGRFLTGSTLGHVAHMTATGALGITFVIQIFSVSFGLGLMVAATTVVSHTIGQGDHAEARCQADSAIAFGFATQCIVAGLVILLC